MSFNTFGIAKTAAAVCWDLKLVLIAHPAFANPAA